METHFAFFIFSWAGDVSLLDSFPFDHGSPVFSFMWHWCLTLFWNISASWNNLCLVIPRKVELYCIFPSSRSWVCHIVSFLPLFDLEEERSLQTPCGPGALTLTISWVFFLFITGYSYYTFLLASVLSNNRIMKTLFSSGLSTSLYQVSSCHWLRTPDRNHLKKGSFIWTDSFTGFSLW